MNTIIEDGKSSKMIVEPFAGLYAPMDFYIASPEKTIEDYPPFIQEQYAKSSDPYKTNFPGSYIYSIYSGWTDIHVR